MWRWHSLSTRRQEGREDRTEHACRFFDAVVRSSPVAIIVLDLKLKVTHWNASAEQLFEGPKPRLLGRDNPVIPPDRTAGYHEFWQAKSASGATLCLEQTLT